MRALALIIAATALSACNQANGQSSQTVTLPEPTRMLANDVYEVAAGNDTDSELADVCSNGDPRYADCAEYRSLTTDEERLEWVREHPIESYL